jgi:uncharacterized protein (DUF2141 family)
MATHRHHQEDPYRPQTQRECLRLTSENMSRVRSTLQNMQKCTIDLQHSVADIDGMRLKRGAIRVELQKVSAGWNLEMRSVRQQVTHRLHRNTSRDSVAAVERALQPSADANFRARANNLNGVRIHNADTTPRQRKTIVF